MSLRTRLILAFLLLSVVPLSAVTLYSYTTSVRAFQRAVEREAAQSAADIGHRMAMVTEDLGRRMDRLFEDSASADEPTGPVMSDQVRAKVAPMLGDAAVLVDRVEFEPMPPAPPASTAGTARVPAVPPAAPTPPAPGPGNPSIIVDVGALLDATRKGIEATGLVPPEAQAEMKAEMEKAVRDSMEANIAKTEAMKAAAAAMSPGKVPPVAVKMEGHQIAIPVWRNGRELGHARAQLNMNRTLNAILTLARSDQGEIPFAIDRRGQLYTPDPAQRATLESLHVQQDTGEEKPRRVGDWMIVTHKGEAGQLTFGIARPLGESLREIRRTSVRNLSLGLLVIGLAIVGIVPISHRMTERLRALTGGVRQLAAGDFHARVPATSSDEFGELARAFNQMAQDLERHQALAVEQERLHRELELSRRIQTEMLPRAPLRFGASEIKGISFPAREVGGDFFNYFELPGHRLGLLVGDVSGKGVSAALLMANVQATLRARLPLQTDLAALTDLLDRELDDSTPGGVFVTLFLAILDDNRELRYVNAGHNPQYVLRVDGRVERMASTGLPLAMFGGHGYKESRLALAPGDLLFFYTDGLVETEDGRDEQFGAERLEQILAEQHQHGIDAVLERIEQDVNAFRGTAEPMDDATLMAMRV